jgi:hypothetical protein
VLRGEAEALAMLDALNTGNPVSQMVADARMAAQAMEYFAGLVTEVKGETIPMGNAMFDYTLREPLGVVARIVAYNHPLMFAAMKIGAPLAVGNTVVVKSPEQAPLSALRMAELIGDIFPAGVLNVLSGGKDCGQTMSTHPLVRKVTLIGSVPTGKAIMRAAADSLKPVLLELGGKNALIAYPDADVDKVIAGAVRGMNFTWAGTIVRLDEPRVPARVHTRSRARRHRADGRAQSQARPAHRLVDDDGLPREPIAVRQGDGIRAIGAGRGRTLGHGRKEARRPGTRQWVLRRAYRSSRM